MWCVEITFHQNKQQKNKEKHEGTVDLCSVQLLNTGEKKKKTLLSDEITRLGDDKHRWMVG
jgi:hypothetical protein